MVALPFEGTILGRPASKKNNREHVERINPHNGRAYVMPVPNPAFRKWQRGATTRLFYLCGGKLPAWEVPMLLSATFYEHPTQRGDLFGYLDALADAMQHAKLIKNDRFIRSTGNCAVLRDAANPRVEFTLSALL